MIATRATSTSFTPVSLSTILTPAGFKILTDSSRASSQKKFKLVQKLTIFFEGLYEVEAYMDKIDISFKHLKDEMFFKSEVSNWEVNLEHLNFFEQVEHLEMKVRGNIRLSQLISCFLQESISFFIQGIGRVVGRLKLKNLKILSVETRRLSEFSLDCEQLKAMHISYGARPNFINTPTILDYLSTGLLLFKGVRDYLAELFEQCPKLSTAGFEYPGFLKFIVSEVNAGRIYLPLLKIVKLERPQYLQDLDRELMDGLAEYQSRI